MLRRVRPFISSGSNEYVRQLKDGRSHSLRRYLADIEFGADELQHKNFGKTQEIRLWFFRVARAILRNRAQEHVNGFVLTERDRRGRVFIFRCTHFDWATRSCDSYGSRPGMCRDYPRVLLQQANPEFLPGCGYRPVAPNAERLVRSLERASVTREQRERLRKDLHLEK